MARAHTESALRSLALIASQGESEGARVQACIALLDRGWGKAPQAHTGEDGEGSIQVVIRHILEKRDEKVVQPEIINQTRMIDGDAT